MPDFPSLLTDLIAAARKAGADGADALGVESVSLSHAWRLGRTEKLERSEAAELGLRVFVGRRQAIVSTTDLSKDTLAQVVERAVAMARVAPEDAYAGLAAPEQIGREPPRLDILDEAEPAPETLIARARAAEEAALAVAGVTNSEGAEASWGRTGVTLAASNGFLGSYARSGHSVSVSVLAGEGSGMERDYDYSSTVFAADLEAPETVGRRAGERAVARLNPRKARTCKVPVVYDPRVARGLLGHLVGAVSGPAIARGTSFLKDRLGKPVFAPGVRIIDDPHRPRGLRSRPFDGEGLASRPTDIVADGVLQTWLLDLASARQLGLAPTGHAGRGTSGPPSPATSNFYLAPGHVTAKELIADIPEGFYVTELMGFGINPVTGDYSRGAAGFWIIGGEIAHPVSEVTVAANLKDMFAGLTPANDLEFRAGMDSPTLRIDTMTVAGA